MERDETLPAKELEAIADPQGGKDLFANRVTTRFIAVTENYRVVQLEVNCGVSFSLFRDETPEIAATKVAFQESVPSIREKILRITSPDEQTIYYTIALNSIIPEGWTTSVERLTLKTPNCFGVLIFDPAHADEVVDVHRLTNADFRNVGEAQCESVMLGTHTFPAGVQCEREENHVGNHQAFHNDYHYTWDTHNRPMSGDPYGQFGFKNSCPHCGFVTAGNVTGSKACFTCSFWLDQLAHGGGFIIEGRHYRPGAGGFGGQIFSIKRNDGTLWKGELFTQGLVPGWMRHLFPDSAVFLNR